MKNKLTAQQALFHNSDIRSGRREPEETYEAVCFLRDRKHAVYRVSYTQHRMDGKLVSARELKSLAKFLGWKPGIGWAW